MITTFQNFGKLKIPITSLPVNQADQNATYLIATGIIPQDNTIIGDLYDTDDNLVAKKRVYSYSGSHKNIPFADLVEGEKGYLSGQDPDTKWDIETIKLWLDDKQTKDEEGNVLVDDSYYYKENDSKEDLLKKVKRDNKVEEIT